MDGQFERATSERAAAGDSSLATISFRLGVRCAPAMRGDHELRGRAAQLFSGTGFGISQPGFHKRRWLRRDGRHQAGRDATGPFEGRIARWVLGFLDICRALLPNGRSEGLTVGVLRP